MYLPLRALQQPAGRGHERQPPLLHRRDKDPTELHYLRARWYDPATGRFLTRAPFPGLAALPQTQHPYVYVGNNPVNLTDPGGEFVPPILVAAGIGAAIGGIGGGIGYVLAHPGGRPEDYLHSGGKPPPSIC